MPDGFQHFDRFAWQRSMQTTMPELLRQVEDAAKRNFQVMALMEAGGRITTGHGGEGLQWPVKYKYHRAEGATGENTRNFTPTNLWKQGALDYRGYEVTDSIKRREMEKNKGEAAIIKVLDGFAERLKESLMQELGPQFYVDGEDPENERFWHGFKTLSQTNGESVDIGGAGVGAKDQADKVAAPSGSYGDLTMDLGTYGGAQETGVAWPEGVADSEYDFWSPLIVVKDSNAWTASTVGGKVEQALRYGLTHGQRNSSLEGQLTNVWLDRGMYIDLKDHNDNRQTIEVTQKSGDSLLSLGFRNVLIFDGVEVSFETAVPVGYGFGVNMGCIELMALTDELFSDEGGPQYDIHTQSLNAVVSTLSNIKYKSPRNFCVWKPYAAV